MREKKVVFIASSSNASQARGGRRRIVDVAQQFSKQGIPSILICFLPNEQARKGVGYLVHARKDLQNETGIPVYYFPMLPFTRTPIVEAVNQWYCGLVVWIICLLSGTRTTYGHGMRAAFIALHAKKVLSSIKVIADFHGAAAAEYAYRERIKPNDPRIQQVERAEFIVLSEVDQIIFVSNRMRSYYSGRFNIDLSHAEIIPCAIHSSFHMSDERRIELRRAYGVENRLVFCYSGSAVDYQLPKSTCQVFCEIKKREPSAYFLILTHHADVFRRYLTSFHIAPEDFSILSLAHDQVFDVLQMCDIGLLLRENSIVNLVSSPTKFAEYLICGLPVITTEHVGDYSDLVTMYRLGKTIEISPFFVTNELLDFLEDVVLNRDQYSRRCNEFAGATLSWNLYGEKIVRLMNAVQ